MRKILLAVLALALVTHLVDAGNKYPIVFVHGLFGSDIIHDKNTTYWGREQGVFAERLHAEESHTVFKVKIGKFSSDWDRAIEVYYPIKGGDVLYGKKQAAESSHLPRGRSYKGLYSEWGTIVDGQLQKVHLMGHSMGGSTIRMLTQFLNEGVASATIKEDPSACELFKGGNDWVHSITTISTPNQGTTLSDRALLYHDHVDNVVGAALGTAGVMKTFGHFITKEMDKWSGAYENYKETALNFLRRKRSASHHHRVAAASVGEEDVEIAGEELFKSLCNTTKDFLDPEKAADELFGLAKQGANDGNMMDEWGKRWNETPKQFWKRVSSIADNAVQSLSTAGAKKQNAWVKTLPNVYYYSFVSQSTYYSTSNWFNISNALPDFNITSKGLLLFSFLTGSRQILKWGFDASWLQNDGCVNVPSQRSDGSEPIQFEGKSKRGK